REGLDTVLEEIIDALCRHVSDDSPMVSMSSENDRWTNNAESYSND
ncbi:hypothetical protein Tco_1513284, partial [Tanacetum coccineum]